MASRIISRTGTPSPKRRGFPEAAIVGGLVIALVAATATAGVAAFSPSVTDNVTLTAATATSGVAAVSVNSGGVLLAPATATAAAASIKIGGVTTIAIADFTAGRVFQRDKGTYSSYNDGTKAVPFTGTYTGNTPTSLKVTVAGTDYPVTITSTTGSPGFTWAGTATIPNGDGYTAKVTDTASGGTGANATQSNTWGVGIVVAAMGQSNMEKMWTTSSSPPAADSHVRWTKATGWWVTSADATGTAGAGGNGLVSFANRLRSYFTTASPGNTTPVGIIGGAQGGTTIENWISGQAAWTAFNNMVTDATVGGDYEFALWHQGEYNSGAGQSTNYATDMPLVVAQTRTQTSRTSSQMLFGVAVIGAYTNSVDADIDVVRTVQLSQSTAAGCFLSAECIDYIHYPVADPHYSAAVYARMGLRYANSIAFQLGAVTYSSDGPAITSAVWTVGSNKLNVVVTQKSGGTGLLDGLGSSAGTSLLGFTVASSGGQSVSSTAFSGNTVVLTMSGNRGVSDTVTLCYAGGHNPWGYTDSSSDNVDHTSFDNQSSYINDTSGFPLQPTTGGLANPITVGTGTIVSLVAATATSGVAAFAPSIVNNVTLTAATATTAVVAMSSISVTNNIALESAAATAKAGFWTNSNFPYNQGGANLLLMGVG